MEISQNPSGQGTPGASGTGAITPESPAHFRSHQWERYDLLASAFEASVQRLGLLDGALGIVLGAIVAVWGSAVDGLSLLLIGPLTIALLGLAPRAASRSKQELDALVLTPTEHAIEASMQGLLRNIQQNHNSEESKVTNLKFSAFLLLLIVETRILLPLFVAVNFNRTAMFGALIVVMAVLGSIQARVIHLYVPAKRPDGLGKREERASISQVVS